MSSSLPEPCLEIDGLDRLFLEAIDKWKTDPDQAKKRLEECILFGGTRPRIYYNLGLLCMYHKQDYRKAVDYFTKISRQGFADSGYQLGKAYELLGEFINAKAAYRRSIEHVKSVLALVRLTESKDEKLELLEEIGDSEPEYPEAQFCIYQLTKKELEDPISVLEKIDFFQAKMELFSLKPSLELAIVILSEVDSDQKTNWLSVWEYYVEQRGSEHHMSDLYKFEHVKTMSEVIDKWEEIIKHKKVTPEMIHKIYYFCHIDHINPIYHIKMKLREIVLDTDSPMWLRCAVVDLDIYANSRWMAPVAIKLHEEDENIARVEKYAKRGDPDSQFICARWYEDVDREAATEHYRMCVLNRYYKAKHYFYNYLVGFDDLDSLLEAQKLYTSSDMEHKILIPRIEKIKEREEMMETQIKILRASFEDLIDKLKQGNADLLPLASILSNSDIDSFMTCFTSNQSLSELKEKEQEQLSIYHVRPPESV